MSASLDPAIIEGIGACFHHLPLSEHEIEETQTPLVMHFHGGDDLTTDVHVEFELPRQQIEAYLLAALREIDLTLLPEDLRYA